MLPVAAAGIEERDLPEGWTYPSQLTFDDEGVLWLTLDGTWAIGRWDLDTNDTRTYPLPVTKRAEGDTMGNIQFAPDGTLWTASQTHIHHLDPKSGEFRSFELPTWGYMPGDILLTRDGMVWLAMIDKNRLVELDPATGELTEHPVPVPFGGPVEFEETPKGTLLTMTHGDTLARFHPENGSLEMPPEFVVGPVGLAYASGSVWVAEMATSSIIRFDLATGNHTRYPTSGSPYYPYSGPSGILVHPDGSVWFAEHFADRIARLDPDRGWLHEYEIPSAPGTNTQRVALGPDNFVWFAEYSTHKIGRANYTKEPVVVHASFTATVHAGGQTQVEAHTLDPLEASSADENLTTTVTAVQTVRNATTWDVTIRAAENLPPGQYKVLLSVPGHKDPTVETGWYVDLTVLPPEPRDIPLPALLPMASVLAAVALRRKSR